MKLIVSTDWHLDAVTGGRPRLPEMEAYIDQLVEAVVEERADVFIFAGDAFDPGSMQGPMLTTKMLEFAAEIHQALDGGMSIWLAGNHDVVETAEGYTTISPLRALEGPTFQRFYVAERAMSLQVSDEDGRSHQILALPYVARAAMAPGLEAYEAALEDARRAVSDGRKLVVVGHMTVPGAALDNESRELARGRDLDLPDLSDLEPALVVNGHYHEHQTVRYAGMEVVIPGSPLRLTFPGGSPTRGYLVAEI